MQPKFGIFVDEGFNTERETRQGLLHTMESSGAEVDYIHSREAFNGDVDLDQYQSLFFVGGFTYADFGGAGTVAAIKLRYGKLAEQLQRFIEDEKLIMGICNGFQILLKAGILPGFDGDYQTQRATLIQNQRGKFEDRWVYLKTNPESPCVFTKDVDFYLPVRHGEGNFYASPDVLERLEIDDLIAVEYCNEDGNPVNGEYPLNPNGSGLDIAGICDPTGRILGLMPHPDCYLKPQLNPQYTRQRANEEVQEPLGLRMFRNAMEYAVQI